MSVAWVTCSYCQGRKTAEVMEVYSEEEAAWVRAPKGHPESEHTRWVDCSCPKCGGQGSYEIETTPCKIF